MCQDINLDVMLICSWLFKNKFTLNADKLNYLIFSVGRKAENVNIILDNQPLKRIPSVKYLGLQINDELD